MSRSTRNSLLRESTKVFLKRLRPNNISTHRVCLAAFFVFREKWKIWPFSFFSRKIGVKKNRKINFPLKPPSSLGFFSSNNVVWGYFDKIYKTKILKQYFGTNQIWDILPAKILISIITYLTSVKRDFITKTFFDFFFAFSRKIAKYILRGWLLHDPALISELHT